MDFNCKNVSPAASLGKGFYGETFSYIDKDGNNCVIKIVNKTNTCMNEWNCLKQIYTDLYVKLPNHVIRPINEFECNTSKLNPAFGFGDVKKQVKIFIMSKLGIGTLYDFLKELNKLDFSLTAKCRMDLVFQILAFFWYLKTYSKITHGDLHLKNFVIRKNNNNKIEYKELDLYITPEYLVYPIDFGLCKRNDTDLVMALYTCNFILSLPINVNVHKNNQTHETTNIFINADSIELFLKSKFWKNYVKPINNSWF